VLGFAWGGDLEDDHGKARDWTLLDVYVTWTPVQGDIAPYAGAGVGLHALRLERDGGPGDPLGRRDQSATAIGLALGGGATFFRTYDFQLGFDVRYRYYLAQFDEVGGHGAHGFVLSFGLHR
jgi:opacity protein-like surface antigen